MNPFEAIGKIGEFTGNIADYVKHIVQDALEAFASKVKVDIAEAKLEAKIETLVLLRDGMQEKINSLSAELDALRKQEGK